MDSFFKKAIRSIQAKRKARFPAFGYVFICLIFLLSYSQMVAQSNQGYAQVIFSTPEVALINVVSAGPAHFTLQLTPGMAAGNETAYLSDAHSDTWLNYTSSLAMSRPFRTIMVQLTSGKVPEGVALLLKASTCQGLKGKGDLGIPSGEVTLSSSPVPVINGVGRCFTGTGAGAGHQLSYRLEVTGFAQLNVEQGETLQVTYTITD